MTTRGAVLVPTPAPAAPASSGGNHPWAGTVLAGVGLAVGLLGATWSDPADISGLGLLPALHPLYFLGVVLVAAGAVGEITSGSARSGRFALQVVAFAVLLHGVSGIVEPNPRFPTAYLHVGFADQLASHGTLLSGLDARFSWPGFFSGAAVVQEATGGGPLTWALRFFPVVIDLFLVVLVDVLGQAAHIPSHRRRAAVLLFLVCSWIGQDYFSPQATATVLYLVAVLVMVTVFPGPGTPRWLRPLLRPAPYRAPTDARPSARILAMGFLLVLTAATVTGHQITPGILALTALLLAATGRTRLVAYPFLVVVATVGWLAFAAQPYWSGHLQQLTGSAGRVGSIVNDNVTERAAAGTAARDLVVHARLGFSLLLVLAIVVSLLVLRHRRRVPVLLAVLVSAPWPMLLLQAYGGEMALRVLLFVLPALSLLVASVLLPARARTKWYHRGVVLVLLVGLLPAFLLARYGNESYEQITSDDLVVLDHAYTHTTGPVLVLTANSKTPRYFSAVDRVRFASLNAEVPSEVVADVTNREGGYPSRYVFLGATQDALGVQTQGRRPGWTQSLARGLVATGSFTVAARQGGSVLLQLTPPTPLPGG
ncbi:MAG: hypothetical protein ABI807_07505 [Sporichthyaceae bacterium]